MVLLYNTVFLRDSKTLLIHCHFTIKITMRFFCIISHDDKPVLFFPHPTQILL